MDLEIQKVHSRVNLDLEQVTTRSFDARDFSENWIFYNYSQTKFFVRAFEFIATAYIFE